MLSGGLRTKDITKQSQENKPLITVVTVVRNGEKTIEETILSVINQTYLNIEYVIVDGASIDGTVDIIKRYEDKIDYWISEPDNGVYPAMNKGIKLAKGEIIGILNSDDWYEKDACFEIASKYKESCYEVIFGNMKMIFPDGTSNLVTVSLPLKKETFAVSYVHPAVFVKSDIYKKHGYFNEKYKIAADYDTLLRFFENGVRFEKIDKIITNFRVGGISANSKIYNEILQIAVAHCFPFTAIIKRWFMLCYVTTITPIKKLFPFLVSFKRKIIKERKY